MTETVRIETADGPRQRISIFLSVFDVHVNRSPIGVTITAVRYQKGKFVMAEPGFLDLRSDVRFAAGTREGILGGWTEDLSRLIDGAVAQDRLVQHLAVGRRKRP